MKQNATVPVKDPNGYLARSREYARWRAQPQYKHWTPGDYSFLAAFPGNFEKARRAFEMHWAVKRLTGK